MAGQPACELSAMQLSEKSGWGEMRRAGRRHTQRQRRMHTNAHEHTCTHIPERACLGSYMCQNTLVFINQPITKIFLFFLKFFVFVFKVRLRQVFPPPSPNNSFEFPSHPNMVDLRTETHPVQTKLKSYFFSVYMFLSNNFHIT